MTAVLPRVLVADPLAKSGLDLLRQEVEVITPEPAELSDAIRLADGLVVRSRTKVTADLLDHAEQLAIVGRAGIGVDNIDVPAATERGVLVINSPLGNVRSTAEHTVGLMFALARRVTLADAAVRAGAWKDGYDAIQLLGKRLGLVGAGKVGGQVAAMGRGVGMDVVVYDPYLNAEQIEQLGAVPSDFSELLGTADVITLHVPLIAETRGLIGASEIAQMKAGALLINCARGGLVDEEALAEALNSGHLGGAALDVFAAEPLLASPLLSTPNTILTPHVAASAREAQVQVSVDIAAQLIDFFAGRPVAYPVNQVSGR